MYTSDFDYYLPPERIAQTPVEPRHDSRLLVFERLTERLEHTHFHQIGRYLSAGDVLVINQTRVIPARLFARKATGGRVEILLLRRESDRIWEALIGGKKVRAGSSLEIEEGPRLEVVQILDGSRRIIRFEEPIEPFLPRVGQMPLPPYIHEPLRNPERYQTVFSTQPGSAAAPTAGLHFTPELMAALEQRGVRFVRVTLHVGLDTFAPVTEQLADEHKIHTEWCQLTPEAANAINSAYHQGKKIIAVGTTSVRTLETAAQSASDGDKVSAYQGPTGLYILPGYTFKAVDAMITNFHLPKSTLLMLVSAFAGRERILSLYEEAIQRGYRFYSFGDAMLLL